MEGHGHIGWLRALGLAALIIGATVVGFLYVPDLLVLKLSSSPTLRDGAVIVWTTAFFAVACWGLVRLQAVRRTQSIAATDQSSDEGATR
jgi:hypothetical protein